MQSKFEEFTKLEAGLRASEKKAKRQEGFTRFLPISLKSKYSFRALRKYMSALA